MKELHITYSRDGGSESSQFSTTGLQHMRTVLSMQSSGTQPVLPPLCHSSSDRLNKTTPYTFEDFKRDVELRATFFKPEKEVITPTLLPPHPSKLAALLLRAGAGTEDAGKGRIDEQAKADAGKKLEKNEKEGHDSVCATTPSKSVGDSPSLLSCSSVTAATIKTQLQKTDDDLVDVKEDSSALQGESCPPYSLRKSPSLCRSDVSLDGSSLHDSSLTSYQVPSGCHEHSTPVGRGGASGEEGTEPARDREGTPLSLTPVKGKKKETTPKPRPLLVSENFQPDNIIIYGLCV